MMEKKPDDEKEDFHDLEIQVIGTPVDIKLVKEIKITKFLSAGLFSIVTKKDPEYIVYAMVNGERVLACRHAVLMNISTRGESQLEIPDNDIWIDNIDQLLEMQGDDEDGDNEIHEIQISPEDDLFVHASNLQGWVESGYDARAIHSTLAFSILSELCKHDVKARTSYLADLKDRWINGNDNTRWALCMTGSANMNRNRRMLMYMAKHGMIDFLITNEIREKDDEWFFEGDTTEFSVTNPEMYRPVKINENESFIKELCGEEYFRFYSKNNYYFSVVYSGNTINFSDYIVLTISDPIDYASYLFSTINAARFNFNHHSIAYRTTRHLVNRGATSFISIAECHGDRVSLIIALIKFTDCHFEKRFFYMTASTIRKYVYKIKENINVHGSNGNVAFSNAVDDICDIRSCIPYSIIRKNPRLLESVDANDLITMKPSENFLKLQSMLDKTKKGWKIRQC